VNLLRAKLKNQSRRLLSPQPFHNGYCQGDVDMTVVPGDSRYPHKAFRFGASAVGGGAILTELYEPSKEIGDAFYVREPWRTFASFDSTCEDHMPKNLLAGGRGAAIRYEAGGGLSIGKAPDRGFFLDDDDHEMAPYGKFRQAMHMPRVVSRLTLLIDDINVERLQDITEEDAKAEGVVYSEKWKGYIVPGVEHPDPNFPVLSRPTAREMYAALWDTIHGSGQWGFNPWVLVYTFTVLEGNIDRLYP
jgi:hypothetical protein